MKKTSTIYVFLLAFALAGLFGVVFPHSQTSWSARPATAKIQKTLHSGSIPLLASSTSNSSKSATVASSHGSCQDLWCGHQEATRKKQQEPISRQSAPDWKNRQYLLAMEKGLGRTTDGGIEGLSLADEFDATRSGSIQDLEAVQRIEEMVVSRMGQDLDWELLREEDENLE